ncbi:MAG: response regulator transcription factor [Prolixibacteraceae bacterium]|nr:response regulator transcription factor [Prolixibacteraceae bacterium]
MIDIAVFDEHNLVVNGVSELLTKVPDFNVIFSTNSRTVLTDKLKKIKINILILNFYEITVREFNLMAQIEINNPHLRILVMSVADREEMVIRTIKAGAKGFLGKNSTPADLTEAVYTLRSGYDYFSKSITNIVLNRYITDLNSNDAGQNADVSRLSSRQIEILKLMGESMSNQEIADRLFISVRTVETHKNHIMQKLNLKNTVDMIKFGIKNNIINI